MPGDGGNPHLIFRGSETAETRGRGMCVCVIPHLAKGQPFPSKLDCSISSIGCQHNYNSEKKVTPRTKRKARSSLHSSGNGKVPLFPVPPIAPHIFDPTHVYREPPSPIRPRRIHRRLSLPAATNGGGGHRDLFSSSSLFAQRRG